MNAQVVIGKTRVTVRDADHLHVTGELVEIQRAGPDGYETVAVAGEHLLVTIEPAAGAEGPLWYPVGEPMD